MAVSAAFVLPANLHEKGPGFRKRLLNTNYPEVFDHSILGGIRFRYELLGFYYVWNYP